MLKAHRPSREARGRRLRNDATSNCWEGFKIPRSHQLIVQEASACVNCCSLCDAYSSCKLYSCFCRCDGHAPCGEMIES